MNCDFKKPETLPDGRYRHVCQRCGSAKITIKPRCVQQCKSRGLGDTIAKLAKAVGIKPCGGCKERQAKLNKLLPYSDQPA